MRIPAELLPADGRFGSGPSKVITDARARLSSSTRLGTSHRQAPIRSLVGSVREQLGTLFSAPDGYEIILGNGGSTAFWDAATFSLVESVASHATFGEFSAKFAQATSRAPFLADSAIAAAEPGSMTLPQVTQDADVYAWPHNETSTGVVAPIRRLDGARPDALTVIDATSAAGGVMFNPTQADVYYFAPQKNFGSDGGLWLALVSPAAVERIEKIAASGRWIPEFLSLKLALDNSRKDQTLNTPAIATLEMLDAHLGWMLDNGGLEWTAARSAESSTHLYEWAESRDFTSPFADAEVRSPVVVTIDCEGVNADDINAVLRENGVVDTFAYRKLGRNQLRVGVFPAVEPEDVRQLTRSIDFVVEELNRGQNRPR